MAELVDAPDSKSGSYFKKLSLSNIIAKMMEIKKFDNVIYNAKNGITSWIDEKLITVKP